VAREERVPCFPGADLGGEFVIHPRFGFRIGGLGNLRHQRHGLAAERTVQERLLAVGRALHHVVAHAAKGQPQIEPGFGDVFHQGGRERTVVAIAVAGHRAGLGRVSHQRVRR
jgi:hypothetical protein